MRLKGISGPASCVGGGQGERGEGQTMRGTSRVMLAGAAAVALTAVAATAAHAEDFEGGNQDMGVSSSFYHSTTYAYCLY